MLKSCRVRADCCVYLFLSSPIVVVEEHVLLFKNCLKKKKNLKMALTFDAHTDSQEHVPLTYRTVQHIQFISVGFIRAVIQWLLQYYLLYKEFTAF